MTEEFYSNGKLLLSAEYAVLDGAKAWAVPTKYGQYLRISENNSSKLSWKSLDDKGNVWFQGIYDIQNLNEIASSDTEISKTLFKILLETKKLKSDFLTDSKGCNVETKLTFPKDWGLGSSSTLINNIANWANVNAYQLLKQTFGGSGYDIACAQHDKPILYQINNKQPIVQEMNNLLPFTDGLFFVYLNKKQNSRDGIWAYRKRDMNTHKLVERLSQITNQMITSTRIDDFEKLLTQHEQILSEAMGVPTIKSQLFSDYTGVIKSLGAWGGDFILATDDGSAKDYFMSKGYRTVIPFKEMVL